MINKGLATAQEGTTAAPKTMYREIEQDETVSKGYVKITEVIAYDFVRKVKIKDELTGEFTDMTRKIEKSRGPYFYQDSVDLLIFKDNNPKARLESFGIQMLKPLAIDYINRPENIKQFTRGGA